MICGEVHNDTTLASNDQLKAFWTNVNGLGFAFYVRYNQTDPIDVVVYPVTANVPDEATILAESANLTTVSSISATSDGTQQVYYVNGERFGTDYVNMYGNLTKVVVAVTQTEGDLNGAVTVLVDTAANQQGAALIVASVGTFAALAVIGAIFRKLK